MSYRAPPLPLVSIVVVNYNYGRFLSEAVFSIYGQDYPAIECIVVDNASTDESHQVLEALSKEHPDLRIVHRDNNDGQSAATVDGFAVSQGQYVTFLDADDYLLPDFVSVHLYVHLSSRLQVGLTSADMVQLRDDRMTSAGTNNINTYVYKQSATTYVRRLDLVAPELWPIATPNIDVERSIYHVDHLKLPSFCWSPTSGNMFRRDALDLFIHNPRLRDIRSNTDAYLLRGISVLTGSLLIDKPLAVYRVHGKNTFTNNVALYGLLNFNPQADSNKNAASTAFLMDYILDDIDVFLRKVHPEQNIIEALIALNACFFLPSDEKGARSYLEGKIIRNFDVLQRKFGRKALVLALLRLRSSPLTLARAVSRTFLRGPAKD